MWRQYWTDAWQRGPQMRFWRILWIRKMFQAGVGLFCFGIASCFVLYQFNGHVKSGTVYDFAAAIAIVGSLLFNASIICFCVVDAIQTFREFRKRP